MGSAAFDISAVTAVHWSGRLLALAVFLQTVELFQLRGSFADSGVWSWPVIRAEFGTFSAPVRRFLDLSLRYPNFLGVLAFRLAAAATLLVIPSLVAEPLLMLVLFVTTVLIAVRWRGTFNGGSDSMTAQVALALTVAAFFGTNETVLKGCLFYIAIQSSCSYFIAGIVKLRSPAWRRGTALGSFLNAPNYRAPERLRRIFGGPVPGLAASWALITFECCFPIGLIKPELAPTFVGLAACFHLLNVYAFGLNRFLFAWMATYPAYLWAS